MTVLVDQNAVTQLKEQSMKKDKKKKGIAKIAESDNSIIRAVGIKTWVEYVEGFEGQQEIKSIAKLSIKEAGCIYPIAFNWYLRKLAEVEKEIFISRWDNLPKFSLEDEDAELNEKGEKPNRNWYNEEGEEFNSLYSYMRSVFPQLSTG